MILIDSQEHTMILAEGVIESCHVGIVTLEADIGVIVVVAPIN